MNSLLQILFNNAAFGISEQFQIAHGNESTSARLTDGKALFFKFLMDGKSSPSSNSPFKMASLICSLICIYSGTSDELDTITFMFYRPP